MIKKCYISFTKANKNIFTAIISMIAVIFVGAFSLNISLDSIYYVSAEVSNEIIEQTETLLDGLIMTHDSVPLNINNKKLLKLSDIRLRRKSDKTEITEEDPLIKERDGDSRLKEDVELYYVDSLGNEVTFVCYDIYYFDDEFDKKASSANSKLSIYAEDIAIVSNDIYDLENIDGSYDRKFNLCGSINDNIKPVINNVNSDKNKYGLNSVLYISLVMSEAITCDNDVKLELLEPGNKLIGYADFDGIINKSYVRFKYVIPNDLRNINISKLELKLIRNDKNNIRDLSGNELGEVKLAPLNVNIDTTGFFIEIDTNMIDGTTEDELVFNITFDPSVVIKETKDEILNALEIKSKSTQQNGFVSENIPEDAILEFDNDYYNHYVLKIDSSKILKVNDDSKYIIISLDSNKLTSEINLSNISASKVLKVNKKHKLGLYEGINNAYEVKQTFIDESIKARTFTLSVNNPKEDNSLSLISMIKTIKENNNLENDLENDNEELNDEDENDNDNEDNEKEIVELEDNKIEEEITLEEIKDEVPLNIIKELEITICESYDESSCESSSESLDEEKLSHSTLSKDTYTCYEDITLDVKLEKRKKAEVKLVTARGQEIFNDTVTVTSTLNISKDILTSPYDNDYSLTLYINYNELTDSDINEDDKKDNITTTSIINVNHLDHNSFMNGYSDNTFKPNNNITRAELATILARLSDTYFDSTDYSIYAPKFNDVTISNWYSNYVSYITMKEIMNGYGDNFEPNEKVSRGEFVTAVVRFLDLDLLIHDYSLYTDVDDKWYKDSVETLAWYGYINGYSDGSFKGENYITRAEVCKIINKALGRTIKNIDDVSSNYLEIMETKFTDITPDDWEYLDVLESAITHSSKEH